MLLISLSYPSGNLSRKGLVLAGRVPHGEQEAARELWSLRARLWSVHVGSYEEHRVRGTPAALGGRLPHPGAVTAGDWRRWPECPGEGEKKKKTYCNDEKQL